MDFNKRNGLVLLSILILVMTACQTTQKELPQKKPPTKIKVKVREKVPPYKKTSPGQKEILEAQFQKANRLMKSLPGDLKHTITWKELHNTINYHKNKNSYSKTEAAAAHKLLYYFQNSSKKLKTLYTFKYFQWQGTTLPKSNQFKKSGNIYAPVSSLSMWYHCKTNVKFQYPSIKMKLVAAYQSPAFQAIKLFKAGKTLSTAIRNEAPPYYSRHQLSYPDFTIRILNKNVQSVAKIITNICKPFGYSLIRGPYQKNILDFKSTNLNTEFEQILTNKRIPVRLKSNMFKTLQQLQFYPSSKGLSVIMAMAEKESGLNWNPKIGKQKKQTLRKRFDKYFSKSKTGFLGYLTQIMLSKTQKSEQKRLATQLYALTNPKNNQTTEFDIYRWSREALFFFQGVLQKYKNVTTLGKVFVDIGSIERKLKYEPQTFGLWQLNINHFIEQLEGKQYFRKRYAKVFKGKHVNRDALVKSLSGFGSPLSRLQTLEMIFKVRLIPRYFTHLNGSNLDLLFFAAENLAGEFSTYRAATQKEINRKLKTNLSLDGDLAIYYPYSTKINWQKQSNSQKALLKYIQTIRGTLKTRQSNTRLLMDICLAETKTKLFQSLVYKALFSKKGGVRIFPEIKSDLYSESPKQYGYKVIKLAGNYK
ncbi:MAG: DUF1615 family protein [Deltaproteobacteria bacterium]|jgi:hypothetical protein|nr:DUF1615 family protein [Deltaproteobacteria bacterium]MBT4526491.1 DUF1615 family protein [Deltaproteobacteria bacterium]